MYEDNRRSVCAPVCVRLPCTKNVTRHMTPFGITCSSPCVEPNVSTYDITIVTMSVWTTPPLCLLAYLALDWGPVVTGQTVNVVSSNWSYTVIGIDNSLIAYCLSALYAPVWGNIPP